MAFFWPHSVFTLALPRRVSAVSMTSSCTRLAVWIISATIATVFCELTRSGTRFMW